MFIRILFHLFSTLAIATIGFVQMPATAANPTSSAQLVPDQDTVTRLQIYLDEHSFGPGKIDGRWGEFIGKALQRFQAANGQPPSGQIDATLQQELEKISD